MISKKELSSKAFMMFRDFTKNVKRIHPDINLNILDETVLVSDLINSINKARLKLLSEEKINSRKMQGFDIGFMKGFIVGNLSVHWEAEYITKQSEEDKQFIATKAIRIYLELATITAIRIRSIYHHLLTEDSNIVDFNKAITAETLEEWKIEENETAGSSNEILRALHNQENNFIKKYLLKNTDDFLDSDIRYFSDAELTDIIEHGVIFE